MKEGDSKIATNMHHEADIQKMTAKE